MWSYFVSYHGIGKRANVEARPLFLPCESDGMVKTTFNCRSFPFFEEKVALLLPDISIDAFVRNAIMSNLVFHTSTFSLNYFTRFLIPAGGTHRMLLARIAHGECDWEKLTPDLCGARGN